MCGRLHLKNLNNTRDLGGMVTKEGRVISKKRLLRSGELYNACQEDIDFLLEYRLCEIIDLRTNQERTEKPDPFLQNVTNIHLPIVKDSTQGISHEEQARLDLERALYSGELNDAKAARQLMHEMYYQMITDPFSLHQYALFMERLVQKKDGAVLWHCAAGKDRAGLAAILVLESLGVEREQIITDYLLTDKYMQENIQQEAALLKEKGKEHTTDFEEVLSYLLGAKIEYIELIYETIEKKYRSFSHFLEKEIHMDASKIEILKQNYLNAEL